MKKVDGQSEGKRRGRAVKTVADPRARNKKSTFGNAASRGNSDKNARKDRAGHERIRCFGYIADENSRMLILGSMPSVKSLEKSEYYAHPQNRFRRVIAAIAGTDYDGSYAQLLANLKTLKVALWDVIGECEREGSGDSAIKAAVPNDIAGLLGKYPGIERIATNGSKAAEIFEKTFPGAEFTRLPSTSPLNARVKTDDLVAAYSAFIKGETNDEN